MNVAPSRSSRSEALAVSLVSGINVAMARLVDIWDSIGIMEAQRVERMETVKKHIEVSWDVDTKLCEPKTNTFM